MPPNDQPARCAVPWAVCPECAGQALDPVSGFTDLLHCPACRQRFRTGERVPCPDPATVSVRDQAGTTGRLCRSHGVNAAARMTGATVDGLTPADLARAAELGERWQHEEKVRAHLVTEWQRRASGQPPDGGELVPLHRTWPPPAGRVPHEDCSVYDPCEEGQPASCPHQAARDRRAREKQGAWSPLVLERERSGNRHLLDGEPVSCGASLELQRIAYRSDDYGEYTVPLKEGVIVRYEAQLYKTPPTVTLYASVGGHEFTAPLEAWMRFRWPERE
jgi:hypothetical protein